MIRGYDQWKTASPYDDIDEACEVCGVDPSDCECPICPVCKSQGDPACDINKGETKMRVHWCYWSESIETRKGTRTSWVTHAFKPYDPNETSGSRYALCGMLRPAEYKMAGTSGGECAECLSIIECADPDCAVCDDEPAPTQRPDLVEGGINPGTPRPVEVDAADGNLFRGRKPYRGTQFESDDDE